MSQDIAIPDYIKKMLAEGQVEDQTKNMQDGAGGVPRLTTKGKVWRFKANDEEVKSGQSVNVVIVGMNPVNGLSHTFYREGYTDDSSAPPDCSSMNGVVPDSWISNPESTKCATCPQAKWGSAKSMSGGKSKACRDSKQLYVAKAEDFSKDPETATLYLMQVTVNSLKSFAAYGKLLASKGIPSPTFCVTKMFFDEDASVPKVEFELVGILNETLGIASLKRSEKKEWDSQLALAAPSGNNKTALPKPDEAEEVIESTATTKKAELSSGDIDSMISQW